MKGKQISMKNLVAAKSIYDKAIQEMEEKLSDVVLFDFSVSYQSGDGHVIVSDNADNASLASCLDIIRKKGSLSYDDYKKICI